MSSLQQLAQKKLERGDAPRARRGGGSKPRAFEVVVPNRLRQIREEGIKVGDQVVTFSVAEVAEASGVNAQTIKSIEDGGDSRIGCIITLCNFYGVKVSDVYENVVNHVPKETGSGGNSTGDGNENGSGGEDGNETSPSQEASGQSSVTGQAPAPTDPVGSESTEKPRSGRRNRS